MYWYNNNIKQVILIINGKMHWHINNITQKFIMSVNKSFFSFLFKETIPCINCKTSSAFYIPSSDINVYPSNYKSLVTLIFWHLKSLHIPSIHRCILTMLTWNLGFNYASEYIVTYKSQGCQEICQNTTPEAECFDKFPGIRETCICDKIWR